MFLNFISLICNVSWQTAEGAPAPSIYTEAWTSLLSGFSYLCASIDFSFVHGLINQLVLNIYTDWMKQYLEIQIPQNLSPGAVALLSLCGSSPHHVRYICKDTQTCVSQWNKGLQCSLSALGKGVWLLHPASLCFENKYSLLPESLQHLNAK